MIDWRPIQHRLGVAADGYAGPITWQALLAYVGQSKPLDGLGSAMASHASAYGLVTLDRIAGFLGQCAHESAGFTQVREIWGPTAAQRGYEGRADLGNTQHGDGFLYRGRAVIEITGRQNYADAGAALGLPLIDRPQLAETPDVAVLVALWYWSSRGLNAYCDRLDWTGLTRRINGGLTGLADRLRLIQRAEGVLHG